MGVFTLLAALLGTRILVLLLLPETAVSNDMKAWPYVFGVLSAGGNPYNVTDRENWPPFWMQILFALGKIAHHYHWSLIRTVNGALVATEAVVVVVLFLALAARMVPWKAYLLVLFGIVLNPVAILLICVHGNFDVLVGLWVLLFAVSLSRWAKFHDPVDWLGASLWLGMGALTKTVPIVLLPLLGVGWRRLRPTTILLGAIVAIGPAFLALSIVFALGPAQVTAHVFQYQSVPGVFGFTGLLHMAGQDSLGPLYTRAFLVLLLLAGLAMLAWAMVRGTRHPRGLELGAAVLLMAVPGLGPGYAPQYAYWFLPLLVLAFSSVNRGTKALIVAWFVIASVTYLGEYAVIPDLGAIAPPLGLRDLVVLNNAAVEGAVTIWRLPLFIAYLGVIMALVISMLRSAELRSGTATEDPIKLHLVEGLPSA